MVSNLAFVLGFILSIVGFLLALFALRALPHKPDAARVLLGVGLLCGAASIAVRGLSAFTQSI